MYLYFTFQDLLDVIYLPFSVTANDREQHFLSPIFCLKAIALRNTRNTNFIIYPIKNFYILFS